MNAQEIAERHRIFYTRAGSRAYGLATQTRNEDFRGVFIRIWVEVWRLQPDISMPGAIGSNLGYLWAGVLSTGKPEPAALARLGSQAFSGFARVLTGRGGTGAFRAPRAVAPRP